MRYFWIIKNTKNEKITKNCHEVEIKSGPIVFVRFFLKLSIFNSEYLTAIITPRDWLCFTLHSLFLFHGTATITPNTQSLISCAPHLVPRTIYFTLLFFYCWGHWYLQWILLILIVEPVFPTFLCGHIRAHHRFYWWLSDAEISITGITKLKKLMCTSNLTLWFSTKRTLVEDSTRYSYFGHQLGMS